MTGSAKTRALPSGSSFTSDLVALLGPTNTGKTHQAIERMLDHDTGMMGLPLRLLAREVYDKVVTKVGVSAVALQTGEEKKIPRHPRYWICTVEAMPLDLELDFVAVDEIQLAGHPQRGHVFCDRLLHVRGRRETWFLGSDAAAQRMSELLPTLRIVRHPRLSTLRYAQSTSVSGLAPRSALVAFSAGEVYALAERVRQRRGGVAVVMGALSPRTRNAQVAMYESGEVDYLVATDAIGMGLNLNLRHVAFAGLSKYDGQTRRELEVGEIAQIAGRAGRYLEDGTFGALQPFDGFSDDLVYAIENHQIPEITRFYWRSRDLEFDTLARLLATLRVRPPTRSLVGIDRADDYDALAQLAQRENVVKRCEGRERVELLWEVCQIPDYRKLLTDQHVDLLEAIFIQLCDHQGRLRDDWVEKMVAPIDDVHGSIDLLTARIGAIRTWTYIGYRGHWLDDSLYWQDRAREIEDRLSDALHLALLSRFVVRQRTSQAAAKAWRRVPPKQSEGTRENGDFASFGALVNMLRERPEVRVQNEGVLSQLIGADDQSLALTDDGWMTWHQEVETNPIRVAKIVRGKKLNQPDVILAGDSTWEIDVQTRSALIRKFTRRLRTMIEDALFVGVDSSLHVHSPAARGLIYILNDALGCVEERQCRRLLGGLSKNDRVWFRKRGVEFGRFFVHKVNSHDLELGSLRRLLVHVATGENVPALAGNPWWPLSPEAVVDRAQVRAMEQCHVQLGYAHLEGAWYMRVDLFEAALRRPALRKGSIESATAFLREHKIDASPVQTSAWVEALLIREKRGRS
jgi:ATP-dependent RNA helicase SUPV3L1/SUV3